MNRVLKIGEKFNITGEGKIYIVYFYQYMKISLGDIFYDLKGNKFTINSFIMCRKIHNIKLAELNLKSNIYDMPIKFYNEQGIEPQSSILVDDLNSINFIFCNHPLKKNEVDEDYKEEYLEASKKFKCALFSYEDIENNKLSLYGDHIEGLTIYRGWMMSPKIYATFYKKLFENNIILINNPAEYGRYHMLPCWYDDFKEFTPESIWEKEGSLDNAISMINNREGAYIVKDFVKSRKHEWYDACYIKDIKDKENTKKIINNFIDRQGDGLLGGIVLRKFENLKRIGFHEKSGMPIAEEYRAFIIANKIFKIINYWTNESKVNISDLELTWIQNIAKKIKSNLITIDLARKEDGNLIIMEMGDGQVSGLQDLQPAEFYKDFKI